MDSTHKVQWTSPRLFTKVDGEQFRSLAFEDQVGTKRDGLVLYAYRALSDTEVGKGTSKSLIFSDPAVLQNAVDMFKRSPVFVDHKRNETRENVGIILEAVYTPAKRAKVVQKGKVVELNMPAGIDVLLGIYEEETKLIKSIELGAITACSATIYFEAEKSHDLSNREFMANLGKVVDGREVRPLITKITNVDELSLLRKGADSFALRYANDSTVSELSLSHTDLETLLDSETHILTDKIQTKMEVIQFENISLGSGEVFEAPNEINEVLKENNILQLGEDSFVLVKPDTLKEMVAMLAERTNAIVEEKRTELKNALISLSIEDETLLKVAETGSRNEVDVAMRALGYQAKQAMMPKCAKCGSDDVQYSRALGANEQIPEEAPKPSEEAQPNLAELAADYSKKMMADLTASQFTPVKNK